MTRRFSSLLSSLLLGTFVITVPGCKPAALPSTPAPEKAAAPVPVEPKHEEYAMPVLHVSPAANPGGDGSAEAPFATLKEALGHLSPRGGGTILLLEGVYKGEVILNAPPGLTGEPERLTVAAAPGRKVVFEGGEPITEWKAWNGEKGLYIVEATDITTTFPSEVGYLDVWEDGPRLRYRRQMDADGVRAYPASVCLLDATHLLIHTSDGRTPGELGLWRNRGAKGLTVDREQVSLRGLHLQNYLGGRQARAITTGRGLKGIRIEDCTITNATHGFSVNSDATVIERCEIREVGNGIVSYGRDLHVRDCLIEGAVGRFAISDLNQHVRDGIRYYFPAVGGSVARCVTAGFWAGLYIKADTTSKAARPMTIEGNVFTDGIRAGSTGPQKLNSYRRNVIGPNDERIDPMKDPLLATATFEENYFYHGGGTAVGSNLAGSDPFVALAEGDLRFSGDTPLPPALRNASARPASVRWNHSVSAYLAFDHAAAAGDREQPLAFARALLVTASAKGALVVTALSRPAKALLYYRPVGETHWSTLEAIPHRRPFAGAVGAMAPIDRVPPDPRQHWVFFLGEDLLAAQTDYEGYLKAIPEKGEAIEGEPFHWRTSGGPREYRVRAGSPAEAADGSPEHPFARLQDALDRVLPGDTVRLEKGVHTTPAFLSHSGTAQAPITLQGEGMEATLLDGGKEPPVMLTLTGASHVIIRDLQLRWFGNTGLQATGSSHGTVERCRFLNAPLVGSATPNGTGIHLVQSPGWSISHSVFTTLERGVYAYFSPALKLRNNTAFRNMYVAAILHESARDSEITGNSFTFTGNDSLRISETDRKAFDSMVCDFNNYGSLLRENHPYGDKTVRPENDFKPAERYGRVAQSKAIVNVRIGEESQRFLQMQPWLGFSGKDAHSIFADPEYVDPLAGDFRLQAESPNLLPGKEKQPFIGALPGVERQAASQ
ncbi:MAG TPA: right-handed parallel beta-helix repeat-containing protein [Chthoniobacteraceae bacterium]|nr:right-handed parallel beta-helix repeat-containing protein [Chthoniobacteraceae bacterium]